MVGGGRLPLYPRLRPGDVSLNVAAAALPHAQGDIARAPFAAEVFDEVYCEKLPYDAFTGANAVAILEMFRVLRPDRPPRWPGRAR